MSSLQLILSKSKYFAPAFVFATLNIVIGTWAIYIPSIKAKLAIDEGQLGIAIFCMALGTLTMVALAPKIIKLLGVGRATAFGLFLFLISFIVPFGANSYIIFCFSMYVVGAFSGFTDVAMNTLVTEIEKQDDIHIMSANHGFFSLGGFVGAGVGSFFLSETVVPMYHVFIVVTVLFILNLVFVKSYFNIKINEGDTQSFKLRNFKPLLVLALIAFFIMASEGAIVDWSALYLEKVSLAKVAWVGLGYTAFSATMALGRFLGDEISNRFGSKVLILAGSFLGILGFGFVLLVKPLFVITGFALVGFGLSVIIPELFRLGGKTEGIASSQGISFISGVGFFGFLIGPVLLGFLADVSSLKLSFLALLGFVVVSFLLTLRLKR
jgi:fucose permease